jgi:hypothetical protein
MSTTIDLDRVVTDRSVECRHCSARMALALDAATDRTVLLDAAPAEFGRYVVIATASFDDDGARIIVAPYDVLDDVGQLRYSSHYTTCRMARSKGAA